MRPVTKILVTIACATALQLVIGGSAHAYEFTRDLKEGDSGGDVRALQIRVAGWFPVAEQKAMGIEGTFGPSTTRALRAFQTNYGLEPDGVAGPATFTVLDALEDEDHSTLHFDFSEFHQNRNDSCSAKANAYAGTFDGGLVSPRRAKRHVKMLMWRLEALRAKAGDKAIGINSGFRSAAYNECIGGASLSQHMYGTAVDNRMAEVTNRAERDLARRSQFGGIGCYSSLSHNHFDLRIENRALPEARYWWWPEQDDNGRDLADDDKPCWGESTKGSVSSASATLSLSSISYAEAGAGSLVPSAGEVELFEITGELDDLGPAD